MKYTNKTLHLIFNKAKKYITEGINAMKDRVILGMGMVKVDIKAIMDMTSRKMIPA